MSPSPPSLVSFAEMSLNVSAQATIVVCGLLLLERAPGLRRLRTALVTLAMAKLATPPWIAWAVPLAGDTFTRVVPAPELALAGSIAVAWVLGTCFAVVQLVTTQIRLRRTLERAVRCEDPVARRLLARAAGRLGLRVAPRLLESPEAAAPYAAGVLDPCIVLPSSWTRSLSATDLENVLLHEAAHVGRRDPLRLELAAALGVLWWWNPAFHWANARWRALIEDACDDLVLERRGPRASDYCASLLSAARLVARAPARGVPPMGAAGMAVNSMERRLRRLMGPRARRSRRRSAIVFVAAALIAAIAIPYVGLPAARSDPPFHPFSPHAREHRAAHGSSHAHSHP